MSLSLLVGTIVVLCWLYLLYMDSFQVGSCFWQPYSGSLHQGHIPPCSHRESHLAVLYDEGKIGPTLPWPQESSRFVGDQPWRAVTLDQVEGLSRQEMICIDPDKEI